MQRLFKASREHGGAKPETGQWEAKFGPVLHKPSAPLLHKGVNYKKIQSLANEWGDVHLSTVYLSLDAQMCSCEKSAVMGGGDRRISQARLCLSAETITEVK